MKKVVIFIVLFGVFTQIQAQNIKVYKVEQRKYASEYYGERVKTSYIEGVEFIKDYNVKKLKTVEAILEFKKKYSNIDLTEESFRDIVEFMREHHLQTSIKKVDEAVDIDNLSKSDIKKQIRRKGSVQILGWDSSISSVTPLKDEYKIYLEKKKYVEDADTGKIEKKESAYVLSPEYTAYFLSEKSEEIPVKEIPISEVLKAKKYYLGSKKEDLIVYNASDEKYVLPDLEKYREEYSSFPIYIIFEYQSNKYIVSKWYLESEIVKAYLPKGSKYSNQVITSQSFSLGILTFETRLSKLIEKGVAPTLEDIEKKSKQIITIYNQANKYLPQLEKYMKMYLRYRNRMSSKDVREWKSIVNKLTSIDKEAKTILEELDNKYQLRLAATASHFEVFADNREMIQDAITMSNVAISNWYSN
jgi:hypothetical protein